jgi:hypothetical protein
MCDPILPTYSVGHQRTLPPRGRLKITGIGGRRSAGDEGLLQWEAPDSPDLRVPIVGVWKALTQQLPFIIQSGDHVFS